MPPAVARHRADAPTQRAAEVLGGPSGALEAVRMVDVAARAGVSTATVSRALRGTGGVSASTRDRIRAVAAELSYVVSPEASGLAGRTTGRVAVLVHDMVSWYASTVVRGLEHELRAAGLDLLLYCLDTPAERAAFFADAPLRRKADAAVVIAIPLTDAERDRLDEAGVVVVAAGSRDARYPSVCVDDALAAEQAVNHLVGLGHERVALLNTVARDGTPWPSHADRERGHRRALEAAGLECEPDLVVSWSMGAAGGAEGMDRLLSGREMPTAVFAYSDEVAVGAIRSLRRARVDVPGQVSVVGVDDHPMAALTDLTTVRQDAAGLGRAAGRLVVRALAGEGVSGQQPAPATRLVVRATTAPPRA